VEHVTRLLGEIKTQTEENQQEKNDLSNMISDYQQKQNAHNELLAVNHSL